MIVLENVESVDILRSAAERMIVAELRDGETIAALIGYYRQQLDAMVAEIPQLAGAFPGKIDERAVPGTDNWTRAMIWCVNVMALEKMNALPTNDKNGTMIRTKYENRDVFSFTK